MPPPAAEAVELAGTPGDDQDDLGRTDRAAGQGEGVPGRRGHRLVPGVRADERVRQLTPQPQRPAGEQELLVVEVPRGPAGVQVRQPGAPVVVVDGATVVGVHEGAVDELGALVDVRDAGQDELQRLLRQGDCAGPGPDRVHEGPDVRREVGVAQHAGGQGGDGALVGLVRAGPRGAGLGLAGGLLQVGGEPFRRDGPGRHQRLPQQQLGVAVHLVAREQTGGGAVPAPHRLDPALGVLDRGDQPRAGVLAALGVVRGEGGHGGGPGGSQAFRGRVELLGGGAEAGGVAADLVERHEALPAVERRVLHTLGHDRPAGLLEADDQLPAPGQARRPALLGRAHGERTGGADHQVPAQHQVRDQVQGGLPVLGQPLPGPVRGLGDDRDRLGVGGLAGHDVGAVAVHRDQQLHDGVVQGAAGVVAQVDVVGADVDEQVDEAVDLGVLTALHHLALGHVDEIVEVGDLGAGARADLVVQQGEGRLGGGVDEHPRDPAQRVVAGGAVAGPVGGQLLLALQDLLHHHVGTRARGPACLRQPPEVAAGVREAVRVVDPEAVQHALGEQVQQHPVGGLEDRGVLHPHRGEGVHVEEAPVVELLVRDAPVREPVPLPVHQLGHRQVLGAVADGEHVVDVAQHGLGPDGPVLPDRDVLAGQGQLAGVEDLPDARAEHGHEHRPLRHRPVHVEPAGVPRAGAVPQDRPHGPVVPERAGHGHVVGDHVGDHAHTARVQRGGQRPQARHPAELEVDP